MKNAFKKYQYTTYLANGDEWHTYITECFDAKQARHEAKQVVGNSRNGEMRHSRITLVKYL